MYPDTPLSVSVALTVYGVIDVVVYEPSVGPPVNTGDVGGVRSIRYGPKCLAALHCPPGSITRTCRYHSPLASAGLVYWNGIIWGAMRGGDPVAVCDQSTATRATFPRSAGTATSMVPDISANFDHVLIECV